MIKKIKQTKFEKILIIFTLILGIVSFGSFVLIKNKCLFVKKYNPEKLKFKHPENIAVLSAPCGNVIIELNPKLSPNAVKRFKYLIQNGSYNRSAFYKVIEDTLIQAGDLEFGNIENINY